MKAKKSLLIIIVLLGLLASSCSSYVCSGGSCRPVSKPGNYMNSYNAYSYRH